MGSWCGLVPAPEDGIPMVFTGVGDVDETERQVASIDFETEVGKAWRPYVRVNFTLGD